MILNRSTEEILAAIKWVQVRRGRIRTITCDNEARFVNASRHIEALYKGINFDKIQDQLTEEGITFYFNAPKAPNKVGIIESIVKICKTILKRKFSRAKLTTRSFMNLSTEVESIINCQPRTTVTADNN